jgi:hypothetical protein
MKSTKYQLLQADFDFACKELKQYRELIEELREQNKLLIELATDQFKVMKFVNKVMFDTSKHQLSLPKEEQNFELLDLAWSTNDCISDNPKQREIIEILKSKGINITT